MESMRRPSLVAISLVLTALTLAGPIATHGQTVATDSNLKDIDGKQFSLSDFRGRMVLIDFFATWCGPCKAEMPHLRTLSSIYKNDRLVIVSISVDPAHDTDSALKTFVKDYGMTWIVARDTAGAAGKYKVDAIPTLVLIDQSGYVKNKRVGLTTSEELQTMIESTGPKYETPIITIVTAVGVVVIVVVVVLAVALTLFRRRKHGRATGSSPS